MVNEGSGAAAIPFCKRGKFLHNLYYTVTSMDMDIEINRSSKAVP
jgi:hypothetical protein